MRCSWVVLAHIFCTTTAFEGPQHWRRHALDDIRKFLTLAPNTRVARNVVLFIGDGMGTSTVTSARILKGQLEGRPGEEGRLFMETLPYVGLSKVYSTDAQVPDSAATATAIMTGVKTNSRVIGLDATAPYDVCDDVHKNSDSKLTTMLDWSLAEGKSAGLVTTTRLTHATPAAAYASVANRAWESDGDTPAGCDDIALQLVRDNPNIQVLLGGGRSAFLPVQDRDPATGRAHSAQRKDGKNLIKDWVFDKQDRNKTNKFVWNKGQFDEIDPQETDFLLGLFSRSHMSYELDRQTDALGEPSLAEMTRKAIQILQRNQEGFFLMVEGGRIDHGHHENSAKKALYDTLAFDAAIQEASRLTDAADTLLIVTADHSHVMTMAGYPDRGNGILDLVRSNGELTKDYYDLPYTTLAYTNGPSAINPTVGNLSDMDLASNSFKQASMIPLTSETHSGEDVAIFARGPMAHLLTGVKENNVIAYVMAHAACVGNIGLACHHGRHARQQCLTSSGGLRTHVTQSRLQSVICLLTIIWLLML